MVYTDLSCLSPCLWPCIFFYSSRRFNVGLSKCRPFCSQQHLCAIHRHALLGTHSNYGSAYFKNQEPERGLFVMRQRLFACMFFFEERRDGIRFRRQKCGFQKAVSTKCVTPLAPFTISPSLPGKTQDVT